MEVTSPTSPDRQVENLEASLRSVELQKLALEEWTGTLERAVVAHERLAEDREVGHAAELRARSQELDAIEKRLTLTLESQSFRLGHLLIRTAMMPMRVIRLTVRLFRRVIVRVYRIAQLSLPSRLLAPVQQLVTRGQAATARRNEILDLPGDRPVTLMDCRGLSGAAQTEAWARVATSDQPERTVVLTDNVDFTGLRALGLSFEYLPPYQQGTAWWKDEADHKRWVNERLAAVRIGYGID